MKNILCIFVLIAAVPLGISARGTSGKLQPPPPTVNVSPSIVSGEQQILFSGSGYYEHYKGIIIEVLGPTPLHLRVNGDANGNFNFYVLYPFAPGYYTVTTYQYSGNTQIPGGTTGFEVQ